MDNLADDSPCLYFDDSSALVQKVSWDIITNVIILSQSEDYKREHQTL